MPLKSFHVCLGIIHTLWLGHKAQHPINVPCHHHPLFRSRVYGCALMCLYALSLPRSLTAWPYFCNLVISWSPWRTTSWYCLFLSSGRFVSMTPLPDTRSMVHGMRPPATNLARSLGAMSAIRALRTNASKREVEVRGNEPVQKVHRDAKLVGHALQADDSVALEQLLVRT